MLELPATTHPCFLHKTHRPGNLTVEFHHVIPVAWQLRTPVAAPPFPGPDTENRGMLWDDRGTWCCPTGHRNVHTWIVRMMRFLAAAGDVEDPEYAYKGVKPSGKPPVELTVALEALQRFAPYGDLLALTAAGEWGQV
jgi:hypothetical protein